MPRAKVAPGRAENCSCSSASSWRGANLSCCATSASASPRASRAAASSWPTPVSAAAGAVAVTVAIALSVKLASLKRLVFRRLGIAAPQLIGKRLFLHLLAQAALDPQREPQRLGSRRHQLVVARHQLARLAHVALPVADQAEADERAGLVGLEPQGALEERLRVLELLELHGADPRRRVRAPGGGIERIADRLHEVLHRFRLAPALAQEPAIVVVDVAVVRRKAQRALEARVGPGPVVHLHVDQAVHAVRGRVIRVGGGRHAQLLQRDAEISVAVVHRCELGVQLGAVPRVADLADDGAGIDFRRRRRRTAGGEQQQAEGEQAPQARSSLSATVRRVRSATSPASWPQAAAMSSPRVLRVVAVSPARARMSAKRRMRSGGERLNSERGNGLNGIRLNLLFTLPASATSSRACSSLSFTPSSITYSKVMKSRGALSR